MVSCSQTTAVKLAPQVHVEEIRAQHSRRRATRQEALGALKPGCVAVHTRNTEAELACLRSKDMHAPMPGATAVEMQPGDVCYFDAGLLHRGWNLQGNIRWTLHHVTWGNLTPVKCNQFSPLVCICVRWRRPDTLSVVGHDGL